MTVALEVKNHAEKLFALIDIDGDGKLSSSEFLRVRAWGGPVREIYI